MTTEELVQRIESKYVQGLIDRQTAIDLINDLRSNYSEGVQS